MGKLMWTTTHPKHLPLQADRLAELLLAAGQQDHGVAPGKLDALTGGALAAMT
jgi:hypothetical protein